MARVVSRVLAPSVRKTLTVGGLQIDMSKEFFTIEGGAGVLFASVKRANGDVQTARTRASGKGRLTEWTSFESGGMSADERRNLIKQMRKGGLTQTAIGKMLGVSQPTVSLDLRKK